MKFSHFFIDRPIFATVISVFIVFVGLIAFSQLSLTQYPNIAPPTITVSGSYSGASPDYTYIYSLRSNKSSTASRE